MYNSYSLYHTLDTNIPEKKMDDRKKKTLLKKIETMDKSLSEIVFLLIVEHYRVKSDKFNIASFTLPYEGRTEKSDIIFDLDKLPSELLWILDRFFTTQTNKNNAKKVDMKNDISV